MVFSSELYSFSSSHFYTRLKSFILEDNFTFDFVFHDFGSLMGKKSSYIPIRNEMLEQERTFKIMFLVSTGSITYLSP